MQVYSSSFFFPITNVFQFWNVCVQYLNQVKSIFACFYLSGSIFAGVSSFFPPFTNVNEPPEAAQMCPQRKSKDFCFQKIIGEKCYTVSSLVWSIIILMGVKSWFYICLILLNKHNQVAKILLGNEIWLISCDILKENLRPLNVKNSKRELKIPLNCGYIKFHQWGQPTTNLS